MLSPLAHYKHDLQRGGIVPDAAQAQAIQDLQAVYEKLCAAAKQAQRPALWRWLFTKKLPVQGVYLWGGVGVGKTYIMDTFYNALPMSNKLRIHFHQFMRDVHQHLTALQGQADPLKIVAEHYAKHTPILCLDEFLVNDLGDAMILGRLLKALFSAGITLITTSNVPPANLYEKGLQRVAFLPAIALLNEYCKIVHLATQTDYRLAKLDNKGSYFYPLDEAAAANMRTIFSMLTRGQGIDDEPLNIANRLIPTVKQAPKVVWFEFAALCAVPRSQVDYLEIACYFHTVLLSNVPQIGPEQSNTARYLINLVDVFYDARVKLIISAAVPLAELYPRGLLQFEFARTLSRLQEMQSQHYWQTKHLPLGSVDHST